MLPTSKINHRKKVVYIRISFLFIFIFAGCYKEYYEVINPEKEVFNFIVTDLQEQRINQSRGIQYEVVDPIPVLIYAGEVYSLDKLEIRGDNTLKFARKGFTLNLDRKLKIYSTVEYTERKYKEFKLLAMVYDYTYIENITAVGLFKEVGLWPVYSFFSEVRLNNHTQGLYHFIEDPVEYFIFHTNASFVMRRGYQNSIKASSCSPHTIDSSTTYKSNFNRIYSIITMYFGQQLYDSLSTYLDMKNYFTKLSIDMLIKNGDYTDEIIFFTKMKNNREVFGVFPWDFDDIFADQPHEIGRAWAVGTIFGSRTYANMEDIITDVGEKLLYSIEDDMDYAIAKDNFLYHCYLNTLKTVMEKIDEVTIDKIFDSTYEHISPFYDNNSIIAQSKYDVDETNRDIFISNLAEKRQLLKDRRNWIMQQLD